jgi:lysozyme family protein
MWASRRAAVSRVELGRRRLIVAAVDWAIPRSGFWLLELYFGGFGFEFQLTSESVDSISALCWQERSRHYPRNPVI